VPQRATLEKLGGLLGLSLEEFYRAAGMLDGIEATNGGGEPPAPPAAGDLDPDECIRFVLDYPDPSFVAQVEATRKRLPPAAFAEWAVSICRAWRSNGQLALNSLLLGSR
jgi:hypothetical protein